MSLLNRFSNSRARKHHSPIAIFGSCIGIALIAIQSHATPIAFPGAVGFGAAATGGRAGSVFHVTNLNDSGTGSFRDAVSRSNRIIVFDVGGTISLTSAVSAQSNLTIAGQTAPGDGIAIIGREVSFANRSNDIVRYIRFRQGRNDPDSSKSGINLLNTSNMIFDHVSIEFAQWNNIDAVTAVNWTLQNSIDSNPIGQQFSAHCEGGPVTFYNNIFANAHNRSPLAKTDTQYVNNVVYNYQAGYTCGNTAGVHSHDIINNYFITGPRTTSPGNAFYQMNNQKVYNNGNILDSNKDGVLNGGSLGYPGSTVHLTSPWSSSIASLTTTNAAAAFTYDIANSGDSLVRDGVDALVIADCKSLGKTGNLWTNQSSTGLPNSGYGTLAGGTVPTDTDKDGIPDYWETAHGLNPNSAPDANIVSAVTGYTNLETYVNEIADPTLVTNLSDSGRGSLRAVVTYANSVPNTTIKFASGLAGTITLTSGKLSISQNMTIQGPGSTVIAIGGGHASRIFDAASGTVAISDLTIQNGSSSGIFNGAASLTLTRCAITGNTGGGLDNDTGSVTLNACSLTNNQGISAGGAFNNDGTLTLTNCILAGNTSSASGGAIASNANTLTLTNCTVTGNTSASGAAIVSAGPAVLTNDILYGDTVSEVSSPSLNASYCDIQGSPAIPDAQHNFGLDPLFVNAANDLHLSLASPCIGAGIVSAPNYPTTDIGGLTRLNPPSLGAFDVNPRPPTVGSQSFVMAWNTSQAITLTASDVNVPSLLPVTYSIGNPAHGAVTGTAPNLTYTPDSSYAGPDSFTVTATNTGSLTSVPATISITVNGVLPGALSHLTAQGVSPTQIDLAWSPATDATGYNLFRSTAPGALHNYVGTSATTSYQDMQRTPMTTYYYIVVPTNAVGDGPKSAEASATTGTPLPGALSNLTATAVSASQINLAWSAAPYATGYNIFRSTSPGGYHTCVSSSAALSFSDVGLSGGTTYYYIVVPTNTVGSGPKSMEANALTQPGAPGVPDAPTGVTATPISKSQIDVTWTAAANATSYWIFRSNTSNTLHSYVGMSTMTSFSDPQRTPSTAYYYIVVGVNAVGSGPKSPEASATTPGS